MNNNRQPNNRRRGRNNTSNRPNNNNRSGFDQQNRIDNRARGNASQMLEKYKKLAADAQHNDDRVNAEYYLQFADHYFRVLADTRLRQEEKQDGQQARRPQNRDEENRGGDEARGGDQDDGPDRHDMSGYDADDAYGGARGMDKEAADSDLSAESHMRDDRRPREMRQPRQRSEPKTPHQRSDAGAPRASRDGSRDGGQAGMREENTGFDVNVLPPSIASSPSNDKPQADKSQAEKSIRKPRARRPKAKDEADMTAVAE